MSKVVERFLKYVKIDTQSDDNSETFPTTSKQFDLANVLVKELLELGLKDAHIDEYGYVMATIPSNIEEKVPVVGFISHMDTAPDFNGKNVNPQIVENYDGKDIVLNAENNIVLSPKDSPELKEYIGKTLITTDGTSLLGADDKAGVAEIMTAVEYLVSHPEIKHGDIKIGFTPDEEVGRGTEHFNVEKFGANYAYTIDGGHVGEIEYENFNAASAFITIKGKNVHPGYAKGKMINSMVIANEFMSMMPANETPETTSGYEGFYHLCDINGTVEETKLAYIIRDFDAANYEARKAFIKNVAKKLNEKYNQELVTVEVKDSYKNMKEKLEPVMYIVEKAIKVIEECGVKPLIKPIRGGTDGARLSFMGLPTPNIFTGGENFHGRYEYIPTFAMEKVVEIIVGISKVN